MVSREEIEMLLSITNFMVFMIFVLKYIYCEKCFVKRKSWIIFGIIYIIAELGAMFIPGLTEEVWMGLIWFLAFSLMILITRKRKRFRGLFLIFPVIGIVVSVEMIPVMVLMLFTGKNIESITGDILLYELIYYVLIYICIYKWMKKKKINTKRELDKWERMMINGNGLLLFIIFCIASSIPETLSQYDQYFLAGGILVSIMIIGSSIIMIIKSANANHYKLISEMNEQNLQSQLNYFKSYQETQRETRRIRHDMKNHMICVYDLYSRGEYEMLGKYIEGLNDLTQNIEKEYHIGNDMADAILNEKYSAIKSHGIEFIIEGTMLGIDSIEPIDICTIFANALDNAIEAALKMNLSGSSIIISVKRDKKILFISFSNPCEKKSSLEKKFLRTTKEDTNNHGFGLENIRMAAEKYKGDVQFHMVEQENKQIFCLEIMLMV
jgi:hypothetical protein